MTTERNINRRNLLKTSAMGIGLGIIGTKAVPALAEVCKAGGLTPPQTEGPFYPVSMKLDVDTDLTFLKDKTQAAKGEIIFVQGTVTDELCQPVAGAVVEIWQACHSGRYDHPSDPNTAAELDENFQYYGRATTDAKGQYLFKTIRPGIYPASEDWWRPAHIHYKIHKLGFKELTTQMYFADDVLNDKDFILQDLDKDEQARVVVDFQKETMEGAPLGTFDVMLKKVKK